MKCKIPIILATIFCLVSCGRPHNNSGSSDKDTTSSELSEESVKSEVSEESIYSEESTSSEASHESVESLEPIESETTEISIHSEEIVESEDGSESIESVESIESEETEESVKPFDSESMEESIESFESELSEGNSESAIESNTSEVAIASINASLGKTSYDEFESLDLSSFALLINYSDGSHVTINYSQLGQYGFALKLLDTSSKEVALNTTLVFGQYKLIVFSTDNEFEDEIDIIVAEEELGNIGEEALDSLSDYFKHENNSYVAEEYRSLKLFDGSFNKGTYKVSLSRGEKGYDDHLIFAYNQNNKSYYSFGLNMMSKPQITYFDGTKLNLVKSFDTVVLEKASFGVAFDSESGAVDYYLNDRFIYSNNISTNGDLRYGFYAGTKGCIFSDIMIDDDDTIYDNDPDSYQTANGTITYTNNSFVVSTTNGLNYHTHKTFKYGTIEATFNEKDATNVAGIAFCLDNDGNTTFFRPEGVTYYYLCVTINGTVALYRIANTVATLVKNVNTKSFYRDVNHTIKAVRDRHNTIHAFLDGVYCFSYVDRHPLKGDKFGISTSSAGCVYYHFSAKETIPVVDNVITKYDVVSGSFYQNNDLIVSNKANSMLVRKTPGSLNGTIEAEISMGKNYGTGLIFRLTKPESDTFYEKESGLSYYWLDVKSSNRIIFGKVKDGNVSWTIEKYMPYFMSHGAKFKIVMDGNDIYAYFTNILTFHYVDSDPLTGLYYGFRSDSEGASIYKDISFTSSSAHEQNQYLIFGHSYTQLWHHYKEDFSELGEDINDIGIGGSQTGNWSKQYKDEVACYNPEWGIYWNGINDIDADVAVNTIITNYTNCLLGIKEKVPNFKCVVLSVSRCTHEKPMARFEQIAETNQRLKELCDTYSWLVFVDVEKIFCDSEGNPIDSYFVDKLHPTAEGYRLVAPLVVEAIKNYQE
ncbi:MAG: SGNH/GDSL hydrolase family protein [Bacilli bacterium]|nr:SGNH/GDSL hydrolase family protein [Bacilli bacterium]